MKGCKLWTRALMALWLRVNPPEVENGERDVLLPLSSSSSSIHLPGAPEDGNGTEGSVLFVLLAGHL